MTWPPGLGGGATAESRGLRTWGFMGALMGRLGRNPWQEPDPRVGLVSLEMGLPTGRVPSSGRGSPPPLPFPHHSWLKMTYKNLRPSYFGGFKDTSPS